MSHPQMSDLVDAIRRFRGPPAGLLVVYEPATQARIDFSHEPADLRGEGPLVPGMECRIAEPTAAQRAAAASLALGVKHAGEMEMRFGPRRGTRIPYEVYRCNIVDDEVAARTCVDVLDEMFGVPERAWLWMSPEPEPDRWPTPLPKPPTWPPS